MNTRKTLSSRQEAPDLMIERLQDYLYLIHDVLAMPTDTEMPATVPGLMDGIDEGLTTLAIAHSEMIQEVKALAYDLVSTQVALSSARRDLEKVMAVLAGLAQPVKTGRPFETAMKTLTREASATVDPTTVMVNWTFKDDAKLREALAAAVEDYIRERAHQLI